MVVILVALGIAWSYERRLPTLPLVTAVVVMVFGGLTLWLQDETFIKLKPTIVNVFFAAAIFGGLAFGKNYVRTVMSAMMNLDDAVPQSSVPRGELEAASMTEASVVIDACLPRFRVSFHSTDEYGRSSPLLKERSDCQRGGVRIAELGDSVSNGLGRSVGFEFDHRVLLV